MALPRINNKKLKKSLKLLEALANDTRIILLQTIAANQPIRVSDIYGKLHYEQSVTSQQLKILRDANAVITQRKGREILYSLNDELLVFISKTLADFSKNSSE